MNEECKVARETEIRQQLSRLSGAIQNCINNFENISVKVECVSRNQSPAPKNPDPVSDIDGLVPLANEIRDSSYRLEGLSSIMDDLVGRIEL